MKIKVNAIEANIIDVSTWDGPDYIIDGFTISYEVINGINNVYGKLKINDIIPSKSWIDIQILNSLNDIIK